MKLWLGDVGEYMISFTKLILVYCLVLAIGNPITIIMQAAKKVKLYHGIVDSFVLLTLPLSYVFLKFGCPPEVSLLVAVVMLMIAHIIRLFVFAKVVTFSFKEYWKKFVFPTMLVTFFSALPAFYIQSVISGGFVQFVVVCLVSLSCIGISGYLVVLTPIEKSFCVESLDSDYVLWMQALSF